MKYAFVPLLSWVVQSEIINRKPHLHVRLFPGSNRGGGHSTSHHHQTAIARAINKYSRLSLVVGLVVGWVGGCCQLPPSTLDDRS